jgi:hypothetical protein
MLIVLTYLNGRQRLVQGESWMQLNNAGGAALGCVNLKRIPDGGKLTIVKSALAEVEEFTEEAWAKMTQEQKDAQEAQAAAQAKSKSDAEAKKAADAALLALLESKTIKGRVKRLLHIGKP